MAVEMAKQPVIGWQRTRSYTKGRKNPEQITEVSSFTLRAWEIVVLALGAGAVYTLYSWQAKNGGSDPGTGIDPLGLGPEQRAFLIGGPIAWFLYKSAVK